MKIISQVAEKDSVGKKKILAELNEDDVILLGDSIRSTIDDGKFDKDDHKVLAKLNHLKQEIHKAFTLVRPS